MEAPQEEKQLKIEISISRRGAVLLVAGLLILLLPIIPKTESLTLTTYYPAPYGAYREMRATKNTFLAYAQAGSPETSPLVAPDDRVGIGTSSPQYLLDINGDVQIRGQLKGYLHLEDPGCTRKVIVIDTTNTVCLGSQYATFTPGIRQDGRIEATTVEWWYEDAIDGFNKFKARAGGAFYCCPK